MSERKPDCGDLRRQSERRMMPTKQELKEWVRLAGKVVEINQNRKLYLTFGVDHCLIKLYLEYNEPAKDRVLGWWGSLSLYPSGRPYTTERQGVSYMYCDTLPGLINALCYEIEKMEDTAPRIGSSRPLDQKDSTSEGWYTPLLLLRRRR